MVYTEIKIKDLKKENPVSFVLSLKSELASLMIL